MQWKWKKKKTKRRRTPRKVTPSSFWMTCASITLVFWALLIGISLSGSYWPPPEAGRDTFAFLLESLKFVTYTMTGITFGHTFISHFLDHKKKGR